MFEDMFKDLFIESSVEEDDAVVEGVTLTTDEDGFVSAECEIDEANILDCDPFEFITEAMYQNVINANNISMAILADNYKYLKENGVELVTEAEEAEKQKGKKREAASKFFKNIREKIQKFFDTVLAKMVELQAKFRVLTKKAQEKAKAGFAKLPEEIKVHNYIPIDVTKWAESKMQAIVDGGTSDAQLDGVDKFAAHVNFETELKTLKNYGAQIAEVKKLKNRSIKAINDLEKKELKGASIKDKAEGHKGFAAWTNEIVAVSKEAVSLIMQRVNESAKAINAACKAGKEAKKEEKKAVNASASFIESVEMI